MVKFSHLATLLLPLLAWPTLAAKSATFTTQYTYTRINKPAGCPTSVPTTSLSPLTQTSSSQPQFTVFANQSGGAVTSLFSILDKNGTQVLFDTSKTSQFVMFLPNGQSALVDDTGVRLFTANCKKGLHLPIHHLISVLANGTSKGKPSERAETEVEESENSRFSRRDTGGTNIDIEVDYYDQCGNPITGYNAYATCSTFNPLLDPPPGEEFILDDEGGGSYDGSCNVPDTQADQAQCESDLLAIIDFPGNVFNGQLTNARSELNLLGRFLQKGIIAQAAAGVAALFDLPAIAIGLEVFAVLQTIQATGEDKPLAQAICSVFGQTSLAVDSRLDTESTGEQVAYQHQGPFTSVSASRTVSIPNGCTPSATPSPSGSVSCNMTGNCDAGFVLCPGSTVNFACACLVTPENTSMCFTGNFYCDDVPVCSSSSTCPSGSACAVGTCCDTPICAPYTECQSLGNNNRLFARRSNIADWPTMMSRDALQVAAPQFDAVQTTEGL